MQHDTAKIRQFLTQYFSDGELNNLCFDYFLDVYHDFTDGVGKTQKIQRLLDYCIRQGRLENLMVTLEKERPSFFPTFFPPQTNLNPNPTYC